MQLNFIFHNLFADPCASKVNVLAESKETISKSCILFYELGTYEFLYFTHGQLRSMADTERTAHQLFDLRWSGVLFAKTCTNFKVQYVKLEAALTIR